MKSALLALCALPASLAGCVTDPGPAPITNVEKIDCPTWGCGENSPVMGPYLFHELNLEGVPNAEQVQVLNFQKGLTFYLPRVAGAKLSAIDTITNTTIAGSALAGGWFNLQTPQGIYKLHVVKVSPDAIPYWVGDTTELNESYELEYSPPGLEGKRALCGSPPSETDGNKGHPWVNPYESMLFTGDRYDATRKTVTASSYSTTTGWMNLACAGSAVAKLHLNRHTTAGSPGPGLVTTSWAQRQALLKMFVSDLCGTGMAFTLKGTPLHWENAAGWSTLDGTEAHEAFWNSTGALCLDTHRLGQKYLADIGAMCDLPACPVNWPRGTYLTSAVP
ncbi:MAG: hypothetical protein H0T79_03800 [Deltaproteobacteria bacterium]|nr:hypothetical protein [Deltaproteobacteria bacterium]